MRILKPGTGRKEWAKECVCTGRGNGDGGCNALLEVSLSDLFYTFSFAREETTTYVTFKCPQCNVLTDMGEVWTCGLPKGAKLLDKAHWDELQNK